MKLLLLLVAAAFTDASSMRAWREIPAEAKHEYTFVNFQAEFVGTHNETSFHANLRKIHAHNANAAANTWTAGVNKFTALSTEEFKAYYKGHSASISATYPPSSPADLSSHVPVEALPATVDWRTKNVVTPAKDQGGCGSCWAFSTAETLESHIAIKTGKLMKFAPQQFVSCAPNPDHCGGTGGREGSVQVRYKPSK